MLQTEIFWNQDPSVHTDDACAFLLHTAMLILLESPKRRPRNSMERNETAKMGSARRNR